MQHLSAAARLLPLLAIFLVVPGGPGVAQVPAPESIFAGRAQTGADRRDVRFVIGCSTTHTAEATGVLSIELYVPNYATLAPGFDFEALEGPGADAGKLTHIEARTGAVTASGDFAVSGWAAVDADAPFGFGLNAAVVGEPGRLAATARLLRPLTLDPGQLVWRQGNPRKTGAPIVATAAVNANDVARLRGIVAPCLALTK